MPSSIVQFARIRSDCNRSASTQQLREILLAIESRYLLERTRSLLSESLVRSPRLPRLEAAELTVIAISANLSTGRRLAVVWGVHCIVAEDARDLDDMVDRACRLAFREGFVRAGQRIIIVAGVPLGTPGATNMVRIAFVGANAAED